VFLHYLSLLASKLVTTKPIRQVPGWWSGYAFAGPPSQDGQLRLKLFEALAGRNVCVRWYDNLCIELRMGTDISRLIFLGGEIDPNEFAFLAKVLKPGMHVLDVGANEGLYTLFFRKRVGAQGHVTAIEPSQRELEHLKRNLRRNNFSDVELHPIAVGDRRGSATLCVAETGHAGHNALGQPAAPWVSVSSKTDVALDTLDALASTSRWPKVHLIKMDVEGMEFAALRGAEELLSRDRPMLLIEAEPESLALRGDTLAAMLAWLGERDYTVMDFSAKDGSPAILGQREPVTVNLVAVHVSAVDPPERKQE
jgi:FkbM family methyltransferase